MEWLEELNTDVLLQTIDQEILKDFPILSVQTIFQQLLMGEEGLSIELVIQPIADIFWQAMTAQLNLLGQLILLAILFAILRQLENSFSNGSVQQVSAFVVQAVTVLLILKSGSAVLEEASTAVYRMTELMNLLLPVQLLLMAGIGNIKTAGILQPSVLFMVQVIGILFRQILLPLIMMEFLLKVVNSFSDTYRLNNLASFLRKLILSAIGFCTMLFLAVLSIQGIGGQIMDHLALRVAKYVAGNAIPVVGGMLSGLLGTLISGGILIRDALGVVGLLAVLLLTVIPAMKIFILYLLYSFAAAALQPLGDSSMIALMEQTAGSFMLAFAIVVFTGILFFFMILFVLVASGNVV